MVEGEGQSVPVEAPPPDYNTFEYNSETFNTQYEALGNMQDARAEHAGRVWRAIGHEGEYSTEALAELNPTEAAQFSEQLSTSMMADPNYAMQLEGQEMARAIDLNTGIENSAIGEFVPDSMTTGAGGIGEFAANTERGFADLGRGTEAVLDKVVPGEGVFAGGGSLAEFGVSPSTLGMGVAGLGLVAGGLLVTKFLAHRNRVQNGLG